MKSLLKGALAGAAGGFIAALAMNGFHAAFETVAATIGGAARKRSDEPPRPDRGSAGEPETEDEPSTMRVAEAVWPAVAREPLPDDRRELAGTIVHVSYATAWGGAYGVVAEAWPGVTAGVGVPFGVALWVVGDELALPAMGLGKWPADYPARTHARTLGAHVVYGLVTELLRRGLRVGA